MSAPTTVRPRRADPSATSARATAGRADRSQPRPATAGVLGGAPQLVRWLVGPAPRKAPRTPFVLLTLAVLGCGLVALLLLNTATASASFRAQSLQQRNDDLTVQQQALQNEVDALDTSQALARAAAKLGMVPGGDPAFLVHRPDGRWSVSGAPAPATAPPSPPPPPAQRSSPTAPADRHAAGQHSTTHRTPSHRTASHRTSAHGTATHGTATHGTATHRPTHSSTAHHPATGGH